MNTREYDAKMKEASGARVADGKTPTPRLSSPSLYGTDDNLVQLRLNENGQVVLGHLGADVRGNLSPMIGKALKATNLSDLLHTSGLPEIMFDDQRTLAVALKSLSASTVRQHSRDARIVKYLANQPGMARCCVLTDLLSQRFWATPTMNADVIGDWSAVFGLGTLSESERFSTLVDRVSAGKSDVLTAPNFRISAKFIADSLLRNNSSKAETFTALQNHNDVWEAVCGSDPLLYERGLLVGSTARIVPIDRDGVFVLCEVSTPFKLRPGNSIMVFGGVFPKGLPLKLVSLDFDAATGKLIAKITGSQTKSNKGEPKGFFFLSDETQRGHEFFAINEPFLGGGKNFAKKATAAAKGGKREIPLDVSLAASVRGAS
jgi:hypothetical protein